MTLPAAAQDAAAYKAFLVKPLVEPAYLDSSRKGKLIECIQQGANARAWFVTDWYCSPSDTIVADIDGLSSASSGARIFGCRDSASSNPKSVVEVYLDKSFQWRYANIKTDESGLNWPTTGLDASEARTVLTFNLFNSRFSCVSGETETSRSFASTDKFFATDVKNASYPLAIFASNNSSADGTSLSAQAHIAPAGAQIYGFSIATNGAGYARFYIPVKGLAMINNKAQVCGLLWDAVENRILERTTTDSNNATYLNSTFRHVHEVDGKSVEFPEVDFHAAVPAELQEKYETVVSSSGLTREITKLAVRSTSFSAGPFVKIDLTLGAAESTDLLFIAWGDSDKGESLADWGANVYEAGVVGPGETSKTLSLPSGSYPRFFRAFLVRSLASPDFDSLAEYIMVKDDGLSYIDTGYLPKLRDRYSVTLELANLATDQRIFSGGAAKTASSNTAGTEMFTEVYLSVSNGKFLWRMMRNNNGAAVADWNNAIVSNLALESGKTHLDYDSATSSFSVKYEASGHTQSYSYSASTATEDAESKPISIFNASRLGITAARNAGAGSKLYSFAIKNVTEDGVETEARRYLPAVKDGEYGLWEAIENKFVAGASGYAFSTTNSTGGAIASVSLYSALDGDALLGLYREPESTAATEFIPGFMLIVR